jgi:hypothetical protein
MTTFGMRIWLPNVHIPAWNRLPCAICGQKLTGPVVPHWNVKIWLPKSHCKSTCMQIHLKLLYICAARRKTWIYCLTYFHYKCNDNYQTSFVFCLKKHLTVCPVFPVNCPNECGKVIKREEVIINSCCHLLELFFSLIILVVRGSRSEYLYGYRALPHKWTCTNIFCNRKC